MRKLLILTLLFALAGCGTILPASPTPAPTGTPQVLMQTVVVTVLVTQLITQTPADTPTATLTPIPTFTAQATHTAGTAAASTATSSTPTASLTPLATVATTAAGPSATLPAGAGGGLFATLARSSDHLALNCPPGTVTFTVSTTNPKVAEVDLFYRVENQSGSSISGWVDVGKMTPDGSGNYTMDFPATRVDPDLRSNNVWIDYQFVGLDALNQVVGRSAKIVKQVSFTLGCPG
ncbi:MAG TPA: hypothetical protein VMJ64_12570 [Anaerolineales bacterium]|nr:hypothetical protein [Anaerolineales bacterium]